MLDPLAQSALRRAGRIASTRRSASVGTLSRRQRDAHRHADRGDGREPGDACLVRTCRTSGEAGWNVVNNWSGFTPDTTSRFLPSAAFDNSGEVGLAYVKTDSHHRPLGGVYRRDRRRVRRNRDSSTGGAPFTTRCSIFGGSTTLSLDPVDLCTILVQRAFSGRHRGPDDRLLLVSDLRRRPRPKLRSLTADPRGQRRSSVRASRSPATSRRSAERHRRPTSGAAATRAG